MNYSFNMGYQPEYAYSVLPKNKSYDGEKVEHEIQGNSVDLILTETPQFLVVSANSTSSIKNEEQKINLKVYPNPAINKARISLYNTEFQRINISVYSADGRIEQTVVNGWVESGEHDFVFGENLPSGIYIVSLKSEKYTTNTKIVIQ